ncbi:hypothetical protein D3C87_1478820 [compost metagenome]
MNAGNVLQFEVQGSNAAQQARVVAANQNAVTGRTHAAFEVHAVRSIGAGEKGLVDIEAEKPVGQRKLSWLLKGIPFQHRWEADPQPHIGLNRLESIECAQPPSAELILARLPEALWEVECQVVKSDDCFGEFDFAADDGFVDAWTKHGLSQLCVTKLRDGQKQEAR